MSDMEQSDVVAPEVPAAEVAPAAESVAPEQPEAQAPENVVELVADATEPPADAPALGVTEAPAETPVVPVLAQQPSSASETQQPEATPAVEKAPLPLEDAASVLLVYVKAHRTAGDADLEAAVADVEASLAAQGAQA